MKAEEIYNGTNGTLWLNDNVELASVQSFTLRQKNNFEEINLSTKLGKSRRFIGYELSGAITKFKVDNQFTNIMEQYKNGESPELKLIGKIENKSSGKTQRIVIKGVTLDEMDLMSFEQKTVMREEIPFEAEDYYYIDNT